MTTTYELPAAAPASAGAPEVPHPKPPAQDPAAGAPPSDELRAVVSAVVGDVVKDAVFAASIEQEKRSVQRLITDLVTRVRDDATAAAPAAPAGVPLRDHRPRRLGGRDVTWTQTMDSVTVNVRVPAWVRKQHVAIQFAAGAVSVRVGEGGEGGAVVEVGGPLVAEVDVDGCVWSLEGDGRGRTLTVELEKAREQWWARLFMADDPREYSVVEGDWKSAREGSGEPNGKVVDATAVDASNEVQDGTAGDRAVSRGAGEMNGLSGSVGEEATESDEGKGLEDTVKAVVNEVVASVTDDEEESAEDGATPATAGQSTAGSVSQRATGQQQQPQQKILTRADLTKMVEQYKEAFKKGGAGASEAAMQLATFYHHGIGVDQNDAYAARLYRYALEHGVVDSSAAFQLGLIYNQGADGLEPDAREAVRWWEVAARLGNSVAMFNLGVMAMNGSGCDMDPVAAERWFQRAVALNPSLRPPQFSPEQIRERMVVAQRLRRERLKRALPPEEKRRRREEALRKARALAYAGVGIVGLGVSVVAIRYWWRNRL